MSIEEVNNDKGFPLPEVDKSNLRYQHVVKDLNNRALACRRDNDFRCTIKNYNDALRLDREFAVLYNNCGVAFLKRKAFDRAMADFDEALTLDPDFGVAWYNRGNTWRAKKDLDRAIADFSRAIETTPDFAKAYNNRGEAYSEKGELELAVSDFTRTIELDPDFASPYNNRGASWYARLSTGAQTQSGPGGDLLQPGQTQIGDREKRQGHFGFQESTENRS